MSITSCLSKVRQQAGVRGRFLGLLAVWLLAACNTLAPEAAAKPDKEPVLALSPQGSFAPRTTEELIQAIETAISTLGDDVINLVPGATYTLNSVHNSPYNYGPNGLPLITHPGGIGTNIVTINGNGATIERSNAPETPKFRLFMVDLNGWLVLNEVTLRGGDVDGDGGALYTGEDVVITNSTLTDNRATNGGAIFVDSMDGDVTMINSTISGNEAASFGGGVDTSFLGSAEFIHTTVTGNKAGDGGAGVSINSNDGSAEGWVAFKGSVVAGNGPGGDVTAYNFVPGWSLIRSEGYNIIGMTASDAFTQPGDQIGVTHPGLAALANNGGPTATHALSGASPALDNVPADVCEAEGRLEGADQRGSPRPAGPACDSGSFEGLLLQTQTITFTPLPDRTYGDAPFTVSASASSGLPVRFAATGSCSAESGTVSLTGAGTCTLTASQPGNDLYAPAESVSQSFSVAKAAQTIAFGPLVDMTYGDVPFTLSASASSGLPVSFSASGPCTVSGSTIILTGVGLCAVTASQAGDDNYNPAQDVSQAFSVSYAFVGFARPLDNGIYNVAKAGRVIPIKWRITSSDGAPISTLENVSVKVTRLSCALGTPTDQVEEYASGSSGLQNLGDGYYQFNWKTPSSYANSCKTLNLHLGEATPRTALFRFVK